MKNLKLSNITYLEMNWKTIALMTGIININVVREIENSIEVVEELEEIKENR